MLRLIQQTLIKHDYKQFNKFMLMAPATKAYLSIKKNIYIYTTVLFPPVRLYFLRERQEHAECHLVLM